MSETREWVEGFGRVIYGHIKGFLTWKAQKYRE